MFESTATLDRCTGVELATLIEHNHQALVRHENQVLVLAAAWADLHDQDPDQDYAPLLHRSRAVGGDGTPDVSEYAAHEFGALQGLGMFSAWSVIADALDLRHRFPRIWVQIQAGQVRAWQARKVAEQTRHLSWDAASEIDDALAGYLGMVPWPRMQKILTAAIIAADPAQARERELQAKLDRTVYSTKSAYGLKVIVARAASGEVNLFMATINRLADILKTDGDDGTVEVRRSKAIVLLAQPGRALQLLLDHRSDADLQTEPEPDSDSDEREPEDRSEPFDRLRERKNEPAPPVTADEQDRSGLDLTPPARFDPAAARPKVVLHYHLSDAAFRDSTPFGDGLVRPDNGDDPITVTQLVEFLTDTQCTIKVVPVSTPDSVTPVDGYEIPQRLRDAVRYRTFADVFPYGTCTSASMDLDHTLAYQHDGGPPGQTSLGNLGPLSRGNHRAATHGRWQKRQPVPGTYLWRSPNGWIFLVTSHGTLNLGRTAYSHALWQTTLSYSDRHTLAA